MNFDKKGLVLNRRFESCVYMILPTPSQFKLKVLNFKGSTTVLVLTTMSFSEKCEGNAFARYCFRLTIAHMQHLSIIGVIVSWHLRYVCLSKRCKLKRLSPLLPVSETCPPETLLFGVNNMKGTIVEVTISSPSLLANYVHSLTVSSLLQMYLSY